jgi:predicted dehydrogenase
MKPPLRIGILGFGRHAVKVLKACADLSSVHFAAAAATSPLKRTEITQTFGIESAPESYGELLADSSLDAIYIALPNALHAEWIIAALNSGKHVICEKPLCMNTSEAAAVEAARRRSGKKLHEAFMYRFHPQHRRVREIIRNGTIGQPFLFESHFHFFLEDKNNIRLQADCGGGGLYDVGCYLLDAPSFLFNTPPLRISGHWHIDQTTNVDSSVSLQVVYKNGLVAHLQAGMRLPRLNTYTIYGSHGTIRAANAYRLEKDQKTSLEIQPLEGPAERIVFDPFNQIAEQFEQFSRWIEGEESSQEYFSDGMQNAALLEAARESCRKGTEIRIPVR